MRRIHIIGVGNPDRGDDGVGPAVVRQLRAQALTGMRVSELSGEATELLQAWQGADEAIVIDAVAADYPAGTILRFDVSARPIPLPFPSASTHGLGVAEAIELARALGSLPPQLIIIGIVGQDYTLGAGLSPEVAQAAREVAAWIAHRYKSQAIRTG